MDDLVIEMKALSLSHRRDAENQRWCPVLSSLNFRTCRVPTPFGLGAALTLVIMSRLNPSCPGPRFCRVPLFRGNVWFQECLAVLMPDAAFDALRGRAHYALVGREETAARRADRDRGPVVRDGQPCPTALLTMSNLHHLHHIGGLAICTQLATRRQESRMSAHRHGGRCRPAVHAMAPGP